MTGSISWAEDVIKEQYEDQGYDVIHIGKPDLIILKNGNVEFIEVKTNRDRLSTKQKRAIKLLKKHGFNARVEKMKFPKISKRPIGLRERLEITNRFENDEIEPREVWNLILRSQQYPNQQDFTRLLMRIHNSLNADYNE